MDMPIVLLILALIAATVLAGYNRLLGGVAGIVICLGVGAWGLLEMDKGKVIQFFGQPLSRTMFLVFVVGLIVVNVVQIVRGLRGRGRRRRSDA